MQGAYLKSDLEKFVCGGGGHLHDYSEGGVSSEKLLTCAVFSISFIAQFTCTVKIQWCRQIHTNCIGVAVVYSQASYKIK